MAEKSKTFIVSDESENSYGLRIKTSGINFDRFNKNPVMLNLHDRSQVLGRWENIRMEGTKLLADAVWDTEDPEAMKIKGKVDRGFIKGASCGLQPVKFTDNTDDGTVEVTESILKEISITSVPSNENALILYDAAGNVLNEEKIIELSAHAHEKQQTQNTDMSKITNKTLLKTLNLQDGAEETDVAIAVKGIVSERDTLKEDNVKLSDENKDLKEKAEKLEKDSKEYTKQRSIDLVDNAITAGKLLKGEREEWIELADTGFDKVKKILDAKKPHQSITGRVVDGETKDVKLSEKTKDWDFDKFHKEGKLEDLKLSDPDRYKELFKEKFGHEPKN